MGLRSGDWAGHFMTVISLCWNHRLTVPAVCFGSLSCWKMKSGGMHVVLGVGEHGTAEDVAAVHIRCHRPLDAIQGSHALCGEGPPHHHTSATVLHGGLLIPWAEALTQWPPHVPISGAVPELKLGLIREEDLAPLITSPAQVCPCKLDPGAPVLGRNQRLLRRPAPVEPLIAESLLHRAGTHIDPVVLFDLCSDLNCVLCRGCLGDALDDAVHALARFARPSAPWGVLKGFPLSVPLPAR